MASNVATLRALVGFLENAFCLLKKVGLNTSVHSCFVVLFAYLFICLFLDKKIMVPIAYYTVDLSLYKTLETLNLLSNLEDTLDSRIIYLHLFSARF